MQNKHKRRLWRDAVLVIMSIVVAIVLGRSGMIHTLFSATEGSRFLGSFIAGFFFTTVFTTAPAIVALAQIAQTNSVLFVAIVGAVGAVIGDLIIFRFMRDHLADDLMYLLRTSKKQRWSAIFHIRSARWFMTLLGAIIIASPLPDELGLVLMGFSKLQVKYFIPISFLFNALGIIAIGFVSTTL